MTDRPATARVLLALQDEVDRLRELLDAKSHEAGLYARRMEQAQRSRDEARAEERAAVVAWLREWAHPVDGYYDMSVRWSVVMEASDIIERGEHRRGEGA